MIANVMYRRDLLGSHANTAWSGWSGSVAPPRPTPGRTDLDLLAMVVVIAFLAYWLA